MAMKNTLLVVLLLLYSPAFIYSQVKEEETVVNGVGLPENQDAENIYNQGVSFYKQKMFEDAIRSFDKAIQLKPNNTFLYEKKGSGLCLFKKNWISVSSFASFLHQ